MFLSRAAGASSSYQRSNVSEEDPDYLCDVCAKAFATEEELGLHIAEYHPDELDDE